MRVEVKEIYKGEIDEFIRRGAVMIDVREAPDTEKLPSIPGHMHLPLSRLAELADKLESEQPLVFFCRSGLLSYPAAEIASTLIRKPMYYLAGGLLSEA